MRKRKSLDDWKRGFWACWGAEGEAGRSTWTNWRGAGGGGVLVFAGVRDVLRWEGEEEEGRCDSVWGGGSGVFVGEAVWRTRRGDSWRCPSDEEKQVCLGGSSQTLSLACQS